MNDRLPLGYETLREARRRAHEKWGKVDYVGRLRDLLIRGKLPAWKINQSGDVEQVSCAFWETDEGRRLLEIRLTDLPKRYQLPVFRLEDLREYIPTTEEDDENIIEKANAVRRAKKEAAFAAVANREEAGEPQESEGDAEEGRLRRRPKSGTVDFARPESSETAPNITLAAVSSVEDARQGNMAVKEDTKLRSVGKPRIKGDGILAEMRKMDRLELCHMSEKDMERRFKAVRSTCRHYRNQVLAENGDN
jgi:hypothetical protein